MHVEPVVLQGTYVRLEPLSIAHETQLCKVGLDEDLWCWTGAVVRSPDQMRAYILDAATRV